MPSTESLAARRMRKQVARACDFCRARRIGCDSGQPCKACRQRGLTCTTVGEEGGGPRSLPAAQREIEQLLQKVKALEAEVTELRQRQPTATQPAMAAKDNSLLSLPERHPQSQPRCRPRPQWTGIHVATSGSDQTSYYGPSSSYYLVSRIGGYLGKMLKQPFPERSLQPRSTCAAIYQSSPDAQRSDRAQTSRHKQTGGALSRAQEESVLRLFWEGYHCTMPIVDETAFRTCYASLWEPSRSVRRACPLVDSIMALCLQNGYAYIPKQISRQAAAGLDGSDGSDSAEDSSGSNGSRGSREAVDDAAVAGRWYFLRAQSGLTADLESPSLETVQCYSFMISYLCCASFQNMCHVVVAQALRTAHILGLHLDPSPELPRGERERRRRIWWVLWALEAKTSTKHGRPLAVDLAQVTTALPSDDCEAAAHNGSTLGRCGPLGRGSDGAHREDKEEGEDGQDGTVTWLSYARQNQKLHLVMADIHEALFLRCGEEIRDRKLACIYHDPAALEASAGFLAARLPQMRDWAEQVPLALKTRRRRGGRRFSTDRSPLDLGGLGDLAGEPVWLQRQAVSLELTYHALVVQLARPFITFYKHPGTYTPTVDRLAATCTDHAVAFTLVMHQAVTETDLMSGWSEYFSLQWSAALVMVAFVLAYPVHAATPRARAALEKAVAVFTVYGENFAVSADAAGICRDLMAKADMLAGWDGRDRGGNGSTVNNSADSSNSKGSMNMDTSESIGGSVASPTSSTQTPSSQRTAVEDDLAWLDPSRQEDFAGGPYGLFNMDWAISVDNYNSFDKFFDAHHSSEPWSFSSQ